MQEGNFLLHVRFFEHFNMYCGINNTDLVGIMLSTFNRCYIDV